ncbi:MAG: DUF3598 domain-containing protein [Gammaproteobacteria bacterium]|nr:DUF3598 domain-containing protein [Gammaproteobacteria bacterium]
MADTIRTGMPVLARHEGEWKGEYVLHAPDGSVLDRHDSHLICTFPDASDFDYFQQNIYKWADGRGETFDFPATYRDGRIWWDTERIAGSAWEVDERSIMLSWTRKDMPGSYLYEMIQINATSDKRARTWHWFQDDEIVKRTCIRENRIA